MFTLPIFKQDTFTYDNNWSRYAIATDYSSPGATQLSSPVPGGPRGLAFKSDGTKFVTYHSDGSLYEVELSTAWDLTSIGTPTERISAQISGLNGGDIFVREDGKKYYIISKSTGTASQIWEYDLNTAWDFSTIATGTIPNFSISNEESSVSAQGLEFSPDGKYMYVGTDDNIFLYFLGSAWDITTVTYIESITLTDYNSFGCKALKVSPNGDYLYHMFIGFDGGELYIGLQEFSLNGQRFRINDVTSVNNNEFGVQDFGAGFHFKDDVNDVIYYLTESSGSTYIRKTDWN